MFAGKRVVLCALAALGIAVTATAELQNVVVGGELRIRGRYYSNTFNDGSGAARPARQWRIPSAFLPKRPVGPLGVSSIFDWDDKGSNWGFFESALLLNAHASLTEDVNAFIELYDFAVWGEDFRSNYITGVDGRANTGDDVEINQGYIEVNGAFGMPLRLRIGRQAMCFGKGWLVCDLLTPTQRLAYDAVLLTYADGPVTIDAFVSKVDENGVVEQDGDVDFYGVYGTYSAWPYADLSAYWFYLRDAQSLNDTNFSWPVEWLENALGLDDYDPTRLHTIGIRANGKYEGWDYDLELAYQFGEADFLGVGFVPIGGLYGDDSAEYDNIGAELTVGYTFETLPWTPRFYVQGVYFEGEDNRSLSFWDWLNPFYRPEASVSFNRLFSDKNYLPVVNDNGWLSNYYELSANVEVRPTEKLMLHFHVAKAYIDEPFDRPVSFDLFDHEIPIAPYYSFWTEEGSDDIGWEAAFFARYQYSEDLWFLLYYDHLFVGDGLTDGAFIQFNGTDFSGGSGDDDADYIFWMSVLKF